VSEDDEQPATAHKPPTTVHERTRKRVNRPIRAVGKLTVTQV
jgi:hypothetical protein